MMLFQKFVLYTLCMSTFMIAGCTRLETFQHVTLQGSAFQKALVSHYQQFATSEAKNYDWVSSQRFINKGMKAAYGQETQPEDPESWNVPQVFLPELTQAREKLMQLLKQPELVNSKPEIAAKAQFSYDCWVEQQQENWQPEDIEACKDSFYDALTQLSSSFPFPTPEVPKTEPKKQVQKEEALPFSYRVFFDFNSAAISKEAHKIIDNIITDLKKLPDYEIVLNGYTDRVGTEEYNLELSRRRAVAVKEKLVAGGIPEKNITIFAFGESDNAVATEDEIAEPKNRRVEIFISD